MITQALRCGLVSKFSACRAKRSAWSRRDTDRAVRRVRGLLAVLEVEDHARDQWVVSAEGKCLDWVLEVHVGCDRK